MNLSEAFKKTNRQLSGQGKRTVQVLKEALMNVDSETESDYYGTGQVIEDFQNKLARYLGKEAAVFFPSGTMAQPIALRIWCDQKGVKKIAYHPLSHLEIHEEDGPKELHHLEPILLADKSRVIELEDVLAMDPDVACLLLELPQREIGGQLPSYETLEKISAYCRRKGIKLQLDGARLLEILPYYQKTAVEVCGLFDSVYVSFYKGIGGLAGAILAGDKDFVEKSKVWKRRHGGDLISLYPYIISADYYFDQRVTKMGSYYEGAKELASYFNKCQGIQTLPLEPVSNMFHVHIALPKETVEAMFVDIYEKTGIGMTGRLNEVTATSCYFEVSVGDQFSLIQKEELQQLFDFVDKSLRDKME